MSDPLAKPYWTVPFDDRTPAELLTVIEQNNAQILQQIKEMPELHSAVQLALLCDFLQDILITEAAVAANEALDCSLIDGVAHRGIGEAEFVQK
jgi:energy-converting hydrogenase A subunit M